MSQQTNNFKDDGTMAAGQNNFTPEAKALTPLEISALKACGLSDEDIEKVAGGGASMLSLIEEKPIDEACADIVKVACAAADSALNNFTENVKQAAQLCAMEEPAIEGQPLDAQLPSFSEPSVCPEVMPEKRGNVIKSCIIPNLKMGMISDGECGRITVEFPLNMLSEVGQANFEIWFDLLKMRSYMHTFDIEIKNIKRHASF